MAMMVMGMLARSVRSVAGAATATASATASARTTVRTMASAAVAPANNSAEADVPVYTRFPKFYIVDTTLREGEQFSTADFTGSDRVYIAKSLDKLGVDYIEVVNPMASAQAREDCRRIKDLGLKAKVVVHTRCHMDDVRAAVETGADGVSMYMATSEALRKHSHGKGVDAVIESARQVISFVQDAGLEVRFSCEDTFRSDKSELLDIYAAVDALGVDRIGLADTVGVAHPFQVYETVRAVRSILKPSTGIEFHTHDDTGCCIANALVALQAGATHINTCVLGIGERNGITPLGGFLARMYTLDKDAVKGRYNLTMLRNLEQYVARCARVTIPFNNYITGAAAFTHKAGVHSKAVISDPGTYEVIDPQDFGVDRHIKIAHRLTGWNALRQRVQHLRLPITDEQVKVVTRLMKDAMETTPFTLEQMDEVLITASRNGSESSSADLRRQAEAAPTAELKAALAGAADAMKSFEEQVAREALAAVVDTAHNTMPTAFVKVTGHLFDKAVLNRLLDLVVESPCSFQVKNLIVPANNESYSWAVLQLWGTSGDEVAAVVDEMRQLVDANAAIADCTLERVAGPDGEPFAPPTQQDGGHNGDDTSGDDDDSNDNDSVTDDSFSSASAAGANSTDGEHPK
ncbi:homocitrate synthase [Salpingoeca rosetta]|uniref:homocitrate synthase n=1 Tax=Salpingoeca rosetta (strain ATCC 50818 / BSB-021) TaxID=946362 RepID=F2U554_SALR5|nr:homocitrate synthase [Salpingoeca rosetta]EGD82770.1 homocitrate synthase [Salpingoeca rosetta]|eukprot:XP_004996006.1 homocitrate synthase [Salpingoeca rosetta]